MPSGKRRARAPAHEAMAFRKASGPPDLLNQGARKKRALGTRTPSSSTDNPCQADLSLPKRKRGYQSPAAKDAYAEDLAVWCEKIKVINSRLDFSVGTRGWCYILEERGLAKGDFPKAETLITDCRKSGALPLDICAEDDNRQAENLKHIDGTDPEEEAAYIIEIARKGYLRYNPISLWDSQNVYIEMMVEKIDLKSLFSEVCEEFCVPITNNRGWSDLNSRAAIMRRFKAHEEHGQRGVLLYCGDHDPAGLNISNSLHGNLTDLANAVGWDPVNLKIDRFGLNADFIKRHRLTWIDNLETGSGEDLGDPKHRDHHKPYVQNYIAKFGRRKVEANALVVRIDAGRKLCRDAILKYIDVAQVEVYRETLDQNRQLVSAEVERLLAEGAL
jgi:hypothetical protein